MSIQFFDHTSMLKLPEIKAIQKKLTYSVKPRNQQTHDLQQTTCQNHRAQFPL